MLGLCTEAAGLCSSGSSPHSLLFLCWELGFLLVVSSPLFPLLSSERTTGAQKDLWGGRPSEQWQEI